MKLTGTASYSSSTSASDSNEVPVLSVRNLSSYYGEIQAVHSISFDLVKGKTLAIVGESGSGKSTLALSLLGAHVGRWEGELTYKGDKIKSMDNLRGSKVTMIFQDPSTALNPVYTIGWQIMETINLHFDLDEDVAYQLALKGLKEAQLNDPELIFNKYPHELSGGQRQRAMIAIATVVSPDILIADEPTTALDATIQMEIIELIRKLQKEKGMALLLITHDMGVMTELADEVMVMYAGECVEKGTRSQILDNPLHPYTKALLEASFLMAGPNGRLAAIKGNVPSLADLPTGCRFHPRCPFAWDKCRQHEVPSFLINHQSVKCFLYEEAARSQES